MENEAATVRHFSIGFLVKVLFNDRIMLFFEKSD